MIKYVTTLALITTLSASYEDTAPTSPCMRVPSNSPSPVRIIPKLNLSCMKPSVVHTDASSMSDLSVQTPATPLADTPYEEMAPRRSSTQFVRRSLPSIEAEIPVMPFLSFPEVNGD